MNISGSLARKSDFKISSKQLWESIMVQEQEDLQVPDTFETVTSVGNAWIMRKSKSHPGRTYYFNTLNGQAVWNLSPAEIEKAKQRTTLENQSGKLIESCPEPMEPPGEQMLQEVSHVDTGQSSTNVTAQEMFAENILNSQFTKQSFTMTPMVNVQRSNAIFCHPLAHTMNQLSFNVTPQFNPHIWAFPPTHQIYISPNTRNQTQTSLDIAFNNIDGNISVSNTSQNASIPLSKRFKLMNNLKEFKRVNKSRKSRPQYQHGDFFNRRFNNTDNIRDLRQVLSAKRQERKYSQSKNNEESENTRQNDNAEKIDETQVNETIVLSMKKEITTEVGFFNENDKKQKDIEQLKRKSLCTDNLKKLASPSAVASYWYLVTDTDVLLNNLDFISELMSSDQKCCLLVRRSVLTELRDSTRGNTSELMTNSRRAIRFFTERQKNGSAEIDEDTNNERICNKQSQILRTGLKVADRNNFVVIITDNEDVQKRKNLINIPIFTVQQIKDFLTSDAIENFEQIVEHHISNERKQAAVATITVELPIQESFQHQSSFKSNDSEQANPVATTSTLVAKEIQTNKPKQANNNTITSALATKEIEIIQSTTTELPTSDIQTNEPKQANIVGTATDVLCEEIPNNIRKTTKESATEKDPADKPKLVNTVGTTTDLLTKNVQTDCVEIFASRSKNTVDASVQTDDSSLQPESNDSHIDSSHATHVDKIIQTCSTSTETDYFEKVNSNNATAVQNESTQLDAISKKREIRLKRCTSNKTTTSSNTVVDENIDKKHFKWRRRKFTVHNQNVEIKSTINNELSDLNSKSTSQTGVSDDSGYKNNDVFNFNKILPIHASNESLNKQNNARNVYYDDNLESDAGSCINKMRNSSDKITVEETSTSGIISNTSNVDSESVHSICQRLSRHFSRRESKQDSTSYSFEVADRNVEEYLRMKSDEWVSRFAQIMEEALTQVLIQYKPMLNTVPPPWNIREAVECIIKKFGDDCNVMDAANHLHNVLNKISDEKGNISLDLSPSEYMEMYTYGVCLIKMLMKDNDSEDLQMAAESLEKLFNEIMDPNSDAQHNSFSFLDSAHYTAANILCSPPPEEPPKDYSNDSTVTPNQTPEGNFIRQKYNLRSNRKNNEHTESTFFSSLELQKKESKDSHEHHDSPSKTSPSKPFIKSKQNEKSTIVDQASSDNLINCNEKGTISTKDQMPETERGASKDIVEPKVTRKITNILNINFLNKYIKSSENIDKNDPKAVRDAPKIEEEVNAKKPVFGKEEFDNSNKEKQTVNEPKIIRNFTKCHEFEEKLKLKYKQPLDLDELDYSDYEEDNDYDFDYTRNLLFNSFEEAVAEKECNKRNFNDDHNNNIDFNIIITKILNEIKETFIRTKSFCENSYKVLSEWETLSSKNRKEYNEKALCVHSDMSRICALLDSITDRNVETIINIKNLLGNIGIDNLEDEVLMRYRDIMTECKIEGNILLETVDVILNGIK